MALFQLSPQQIAGRSASSHIPGFRESLLRGTLGFTALSIAGFSPWAIFERWFRMMREMDLYIACTAVFIGLSGLFLHRLLIGTGSLWRFYALFTSAFLAYAGTWVSLWIAMRGDKGEFLALLGGCVVMAAVFAWAFDAWRQFLSMAAAIFSLQAAGYYAGRWFDGELMIHYRYTAMALWAVCYGLGFGAGLGLALYLAQSRARSLIAGVPEK